MKYLQDLFEKVLGKDKVILFTVNPAVDRVLECGTIPTLFNTVDFGPGMWLEVCLFLILYFIFYCSTIDVLLYIIQYV